jgi:cell fate (sporulation/competence/biofilm development) regulator YlbF (YheA/YmcA/DUF963 family)
MSTVDNDHVAKQRYLSIFREMKTVLEEYHKHCYDDTYETIQELEQLVSKALGEQEREDVTLNN